MTYKNKEGYPDPTSGRVILYVKSQSEESSDRGRIKKSEKVRKSYWIVELYRHCVLLKDEKGFCTAPSYIQLQSLMRGGD